MRQSRRHRPWRSSNRAEQFSCPSSNKFHQPSQPFLTLRFYRSCFSLRQRQRPLTPVFAQETHGPLCSFVSRCESRANPLVETREFLQSQMHIIAPGSQEEKQKAFKVGSRGPNIPTGAFHKTLLFFRIWEYALWGQNPRVAVKGQS